jgi:hypothetical protein
LSYAASLRITSSNAVLLLRESAGELCQHHRYLPYFLNPLAYKEKPREHLEFTGFSAAPAPGDYFMRIICFGSSFPSPASSGEGDNKKEHPLGEGASDEITRSPLRGAILFLFSALLSVCRHRESIELSCIVIEEKQHGRGLHGGSFRD